MGRSSNMVKREAQVGRMTCKRNCSVQDVVSEWKQATYTKRKSTVRCALKS